MKRIIILFLLTSIISVASSGLGEFGPNRWSKIDSERYKNFQEEVNASSVETESKEGNKYDIYIISYRNKKEICIIKIVTNKKGKVIHFEEDIKIFKIK